MYVLIKRDVVVVLLVGIRRKTPLPLNIGNEKRNRTRNRKSKKSTESR